MLEGLVENLLLNKLKLGDYLEGIQREHLKVALWSGPPLSAPLSLPCLSSVFNGIDPCLLFLLLLLLLLFTGTVTLTDVKLKRGALDALKLPIEVK
jgi:hypothetical protein